MDARGFSLWVICSLPCDIGCTPGMRYLSYLDEERNFRTPGILKKSRVGSETVIMSYVPNFLGPAMGSLPFMAMNMAFFHGG